MCIAGKGWEILAYISITVFYVLVKLQIRREVCSEIVRLIKDGSITYIAPASEAIDLTISPHSGQFDRPFLKSQCLGACPAGGRGG